MRAALAIVREDEYGRTTSRDEIPGPATMGRLPTNEIVVAHRSVARRHARIEPIGDRWWLRDNRSQNGTFLNGRRVDQVALANRDQILIGGFIYRVELSGGPEPVPYLDLLSEPPSGDGWDGALFERGRRGIYVGDAGGLVERGHFRAGLELRASTIGPAVRPWRVSAHGRSDQWTRTFERAWLPGVDARQLVARLGQLDGDRPRAVVSAVIAGIAHAMRDLDGYGSVHGDDLLITWDGELLVTVPPGQEPNEDVRLIEAQHLVRELDPRSGYPVRSWPNAVVTYGAPDPELLAGFLASAFPWWRAHQLTWAEEAALV
jgi:hypothetical protein